MNSHEVFYLKIPMESNSYLNFASKANKKTFSKSFVINLFPTSKI